MDTDLCFQLDDSGSCFQEFQAYAVKGSRAETGSLEQVVSETVQQNISCRVQKQPELVCKKTVTGGTVAFRVGLVILYVQLIISSSTVDILVERFGLSFMHIGADKTDIQLSNVGHLDFCDNGARLAPALCLVHESVIALEACWLLLYVFNQDFDMFEQNVIAGQTGHTIAIRLLVKVGKDFRN